MLRLLETPDLVLAQTVKFLCSDDGSFHVLRDMVNESPPTQLVSTFSYLSYWISDSLSKHKSKYNDTKTQQCLQLLNLISTKVPPIILINGAFDLNWGISQPHWALHEFYQRINKRITIIRSYLKPQSAFGQIYPFPLNSEFKEDFWRTFNPNLSIDIGTDQDYIFAAKIHFKRLLRNRVPIQLFKPLLDTPSMKKVLTQAIIEVLNETNENPNITHIQSISTFSLLFLYIFSFSLSNDIDAQMLCEYIQTCDYLSPGLALGIICHISTTICLYNYLMPKEFIENPGSDKSHYVIYDHSNDTELDSFFQSIPEMFTTYFKPPTTNQNQEINSTVKNDINSFLTYIHDPNTMKVQKFKAIFEFAKNHEITPIYTVTISFYVSLRFLIIVPRMFEHFNNPNICKFFMSIISFITPVCDTSIQQLFNNPVTEDYNIIDKNLYLLIRAIGTRMLTLVINLPMEISIPFCLDSLNRYTNTQKITAGDYHHIFRRILSADFPVLGPATLESLEKCRDIVILSMYVEALTSTVHTHTCKGRDSLRSLRQKILDRLPIQADPTMPYLLITEFRGTSRDEFNEVSCNIFADVISMKLDSPREVNMNNCLFCVFSASMRKKFFAEYVVHFLENHLNNDRKDVSEQDPLPLTESEICIPLAQMCLPRLLTENFIDLANELSIILGYHMKNDDLMLHWLTKFTAQYRQYLTPEVKRSLRTPMIDRYQSKLPKGVDFKKENVYEFADQLVKAENTIVFDADTLFAEYTSPYLLQQAIIRSFILLSPQSDIGIVKLLTMPLYEVKFWPNRNEGVIELAKLASTMSTSILHDYFRELMGRSPCDSAMISGRIFLSMVRIDVFEIICETCSTYIEKNAEKLDYFMRMALPSFHRLYGNPQSAKDFLCGLLVSITPQTPRSLQEAVIDAVGLIYLKLKLFDFRKEIINSAMSFEPDLKAVFACSLDPDIANQRVSDLFKTKEVPFKMKKSMMEMI
ncbi:hypothetical protein TVAG_402130 [Trichomonas vaginalis G3]|uniref:Uncharacterized protein n=1 Tax=Trichomonas vaginalis (strain ATCC PRA-98 / G3) TaxID=412133 RepID=A2DHX0_TRIV3|nr:hypothetical protein TVAGG3_0271640 [Trichomonas vaginalis G3]EAY19959.1 hypothetical protein TVAG_402130 [Trichomonas vaginalis G3]KAI5525909.1 hypothetical protein TVAGG3_0271640 [Trichomonas vaginalis G3]|eukprot:XP_001580945.1 hypothetical protein [Trichomonas vaginalis G3]